MKKIGMTALLAVSFSVGNTASAFNAAGMNHFEYDSSKYTFDYDMFYQQQMLDNTFDGINSKYLDAVNNRDYEKVIENGNKIVEMKLKEESTTENKNIIISRYREVAFSYEKLGRLEKCVETFKKLYDYANQFGNEFYQDLRVAKSRIDQYTTVVEMYTQTSDDKYYAEKHEPKNGVLFGACADGPIRKYIDNESMVLVYQELGTPLIQFVKKTIEEANKKDLLVELALNCPKQGDDIRNIHNMVSYLDELSKYLKQYPDVKILLRFAAEFDIWPNSCTPEEFKTAFRLVSNHFKSRNDNVAMVWSPNQVSNWDINIDDYYPGDEYVDWVGMSSYASKYFLGDVTSTEENQMLFMTGVNSNPVIAIKSIVEKYGDRKPIMLSESGSCHFVKSQNEDVTDFALQKLKEYYLNLTMVYPQVKLIAYFDKYFEGEPNDYRLTVNPKIQEEYLRLINTSRFIQHSADNNAPVNYTPIENGNYFNDVLSISTYTHVYGETVYSVAYYIDDVFVASSENIPFTTYIDLQNLSVGKHLLKAAAVTEKGNIVTSTKTINVTSPSDISVYMDGELISFTQKPVFYNNRTMVPLRVIFEKLGATVTWDDTTKTATAVKDGKTVKITLDSSKMYVNGKEKKLDAPAIVLSGTTLVPVRAIAESFDCNVDWDSVNSAVTITSVK